MLKCIVLLFCIAITITKYIILLLCELKNVNKCPLVIIIVVVKVIYKKLANENEFKVSERKNQGTTTTATKTTKKANERIAYYHETSTSQQAKQISPYYFSYHSNHHQSHAIFNATHLSLT